MPTFEYKGMSGANETVSGEIKAASRDAAVAMLRGKKIRVQILKKKTGGFDFNSINNLGATVKLADVSRFTRQFAAMTSAGLPLVQCMDILSEQSENKLLQEAVRQVSSDIQGGSALSEALSKHPKVFNSLYCNMVDAGEQSGNLDGVLVRLAEYQEKADAIIRKVKGAMTYPIILILVLVGAVSVMLTFVVPQFASMFSELGGTLPLPTRIVMWLSDFLKAYIIYMVLGSIAAIIATMQYYKTDKGAYVLDNIMLHLPVMGDLVRKSSISRFSQTLSTLLNSGVSIIKALQITAKTSGNKVLEKGLYMTVEKITGGQSVSEPLAATKLFPPMVTQMIAVGEKTGDIATMLAKISQFYEEEVDAAVDALTAVLEPIMIVVMGVVVGGMLVAMYMPMFDMVNMVH